MPPRRLHLVPLALVVTGIAILKGSAALAQTAAAPELDAAPDAGVAPAPDDAPIPPAPAPEISADDEAGDDAAPVVKKKRKKVQIGGRVHAGYEMKREAVSLTDATRDTKNEFAVKRARLKLSWQPEDWLLTVVQVDVAEAFQLGGSILRDAYIHLSPLDQLQIRIGQFKKPFSALALQSPSKLRIIERGPGIKHIVEDLQYGDRDLGVQLSGRLVKAVKLDYSLGVFNGSGANMEEMDNSKDVVARLQLRPFKQLELGVNGSVKFFSDPRERQVSGAFAGGGDARLQIKGFRLYAEGLAAPDHLAYLTNSDADANSAPRSFVVLGIASYRHKFKTTVPFAVEPVFKFELFDPDAIVIADHLLVFTPGLNVYLGRYFRVLLDGEFVRSNRNSPESYRDSEAIQVLACFDI